MLRKIYADMAWDTYGDKKYESKQTFVSEILGHDGLLTSFSYTTINVDNPEGMNESNPKDMNDIDIKNKFKELNEKISFIQTQMLKPPQMPIQITKPPPRFKNRFMNYNNRLSASLKTLRLR
jgi:hypothetical protein